MLAIGLDVRRAADYTALTVVENHIVRLEQNDENGVPQYQRCMDVRHLQRYPLNTPYSKIRDEMSNLIKTPQVMAMPWRLIVDATGVGRPVVDMLREANLNPCPMTITAGNAENYNEETNYWNVSKKILVSNLQVLLGNEDIRFADDLPMRDVVINELLAFRMKMTAKGNDTYEAWREKDHDDLVLAVAIACWYLERFGKKKPKKEKQSRRPSLATAKYM